MENSKEADDYLLLLLLLLLLNLSDNYFANFVSSITALRKSTLVNLFEDE